MADTAPQSYVLPSGMGLVFVFPNLVTNVVNNNASQQILISDQPSGSNFTLSWSGQTTASIPTIPSPPYRYFQWNGTLSAAGPRDLAVNPYVGGTGSPSVLYEVFDGSTLLGTATLNHATDYPGGYGGATNPAPFADPGGLLRLDGGTLYWYPLGRFTFTTTTISVRISCPGGNVDGRNNMTFDNLRIATTDGLTVVRLDTGRPPATLVSTGVGGLDPTYQYFWQCADDVHNAMAMDGQGSGFRYLADPAVVQSSLQALSSIGTGNITVTGNGYSLSPMILEFVGTLAGGARALIATDDVNVTTANLAIGGVLPSIRINGGSSIPLSYAWLHYYPTNHAMPGVVFMFPQSSPAATYSSVRYRDNTAAGNWQQAGALGVPSSVGYTSNTLAVSGSTPTATYVFRPVPDGQYRVSATWPHDASYSADVVYTVRDVAGNLLGTYHTDQTIAPSGAVDGGVPWLILGTFTLTGLNNGLVVTQSNGTSTLMLADTIRFERVSADTSIKILATDTVTYSTPGGWATCLDGPAAPATNVLVTSRINQTLHPPLPISATMAVGYNLEAVANNSGSFIYNNLLSHSYQLRTWPTALSASTGLYVLNFTPTSQAADNKGLPNLPTGHHILAWDGASDLHITTQSGSAAEYAASNYPAPGGVGNRRYYDFQGDSTSYGAQCFIVIHGTTMIGSGPNWNADISNGVLCPADLDPTSFPRFRANNLARYAGMKSIRCMDSSGAIDSNPTDFTDLNPPAGWVTKGGGPVRTVTLSPHTIGQYTGTAVILDPARGQLYLFTCTAPHGLGVNQLVNLPATGPCVANLINDLGHTSTFDLANWDGFVYPVDATSFVWYNGVHAEVVSGVAHPYTMVGTLTDPPLQVVMNAGNCFPVRDQVDFCNQTGCSMHWNMAFTATDACCTQFGTFIAQNLNPGLKLRMACSNETWNFQNKPYQCASAGSYQYGGSSDDPVRFTCQMANHQWQLIEAAWVAAGRDIGDTIRVLEGLYFDSGYTGRMASYCQAQGFTFDEFAVAPYLHNNPSFVSGYSPEGQFQDIVDRINANIGQLLDMWDYHYTYGRYEGEMPSHRSQLDLYGFTSAKLITYEGGPEGMFMPGGSGINRGPSSHAFIRHPRWYDLYQHSLRVLQDSNGGNTGCTLFHDYLVSGGAVGAGNNYAQWDAYSTTLQLPYAPGNPTQDAIQINQFDRVDLVQSVTGAALLAYAARYTATPATPTGTGGLTLSGRAPVTVSPPPTTTVTSRPIRLFPMRRRG